MGASVVTHICSSNGTYADGRNRQRDHSPSVKPLPLSQTRVEAEAESRGTYTLFLFCVCVSCVCVWCLNVLYEVLLFLCVGGHHLSRYADAACSKQDVRTNTVKIGGAAKFKTSVYNRKHDTSSRISVETKNVFSPRIPFLVRMSYRGLYIVQ